MLVVQEVLVEVEVILLFLVLLVQETHLQLVHLKEILVVVLLVVLKMEQVVVEQVLQEIQGNQEILDLVELAQHLQLMEHLLYELVVVEVMDNRVMVLLHLVVEDLVEVLELQIQVAVS